MYSRNPGECVYVPDTELTVRADQIAIEAHSTTDARYGRWMYIVHPHMGAQRVKDEGYGDVVQAVALLHDTVEETRKNKDASTHESPNSLLLKLLHDEVPEMQSPSMLVNSSLGVSVLDALIIVDAVDAMTDVPGERRSVKLARAKQNPVARVVDSLGDAGSHIDYNEWKLEQRFRRSSAKKRIKRYKGDQEFHGELPSPEDMEVYLDKERQRVARQLSSKLVLF